MQNCQILVGTWSDTSKAKASCKSSRNIAFGCFCSRFGLRTCFLRRHNPLSHNRQCNESSVWVVCVFWYYTLPKRGCSHSKFLVVVHAIVSRSYFTNLCILLLQSSTTQGNVFDPEVKQVVCR